MRTCSFVSIASVTALTLVFAACGGSKPANVPDNPPGGGSGSATAPAPEPSTTTTTTTTLGNGGDLQGAKLATSSTTTVETKGTDSGAKPSGKGGEPGRTREDIQTIILSRRDEARACYDEALKKNPSLEGDLDIKWKIDPDGVVTEIGPDDSKSTIHDKGVSDCISAIIKKIKFAKSNMGKESTMHYPYNFHPKQGQVGNKGAQPPKP